MLRIGETWPQRRAEAFLKAIGRRLRRCGLPGDPGQPAPLGACFFHFSPIECL
jgi:hypothetical protein